MFRSPRLKRRRSASPRRTASPNRLFRMRSPFRSPGLFRRRSASPKFRRLSSMSSSASSSSRGYENLASIYDNKISQGLATEQEYMNFFKRYVHQVAERFNKRVAHFLRDAAAEDAYYNFMVTQNIEHTMKELNNSLIKTFKLPVPLNTPLHYQILV